jgi:hypothetical protein
MSPKQYPLYIVDLITMEAVNKPKCGTTVQLTGLDFTKELYGYKGNLCVNCRNLNIDYIHI